MKFFLAAVILIVASNAVLAKEIVANIEDIGVRWGEGCITLSSGHTLHTNLKTEAGKAEYSTALAAFTMKKSIGVFITGTKTNNICNVVEVADHGMIYLKP